LLRILAARIWAGVIVDVESLVVWGSVVGERGVWGLLVLVVVLVLLMARLKNSVVVVMVMTTTARRGLIPWGPSSSLDLNLNLNLGWAWRALRGGWVLGGDLRGVVSVG
jgi:hypothetical protein